MQVAAPEEEEQAEARLSELLHIARIHRMQAQVKGPHPCPIGRIKSRCIISSSLLLTTNDMSHCLMLYTTLSLCVFR